MAAQSAKQQQLRYALPRRLCRLLPALRHLSAPPHYSFTVSPSYAFQTASLARQ
ncbi:hypothetical protein [Kingella potus]|uniref:hypothetical protein n=1 Tax=Kingella potus TaxID=265175 RepID=UPI001FD151F9|nr:hypothetical protein [Kingella potus]UOP01759.1 hypothetical protein LVJ84_06510 [Kingella potus]